MSFGSRLAHAWNVFKEGEKDISEPRTVGYWSSSAPHRTPLSFTNERSIVSAIITRMSMDVASFDFQHVRIDQEGQFSESIDSFLNNCLRVEANKDQTGRAFVREIAMTMLDEGSVAVVPIDTSLNPLLTSGYDIHTMRVGRILEWYPDDIRVDVYNDRTGQRENVLVPKNITGIFENPLYSLLNAPNSTLKRLSQKLGQLDIVDDKISSRKLDLIIQFPYSISGAKRIAEAEERIKNLEQQLRNSEYAIGYADGADKITQLNRPVENNLFNQVQYLTKMLFDQLGMSEEVLSGVATEQVLRNYYDRTIEPLVTTIVEEMRRKFLTKTARTQGQSIMAFRDTFRLMPANEIAEIADVFSRNEIMSANEIRSVIGMKPSTLPQANELRNKNMPVQEVPKTDLQVAKINKTLKQIQSK